MNKEQQELLDEVYHNYSKEYEKDNSVGLTLLVQRIDGKTMYTKPDKEMFISLCEYDKHFSEKWGLNIEERELSHQERSDLKNSPPYEYGKPANGKLIDERLLNSNNVPTKLITLTYNNEIIESYE